MYSVVTELLNKPFKPLIYQEQNFQSAVSPELYFLLLDKCIGLTGGLQVKLSELPWMEHQEWCSIALISGGPMP